MRVRISGITAASMLWYALVLVVAATAVAADTPTPLRSENMWIASAPIITEPGPMRLALTTDYSSKPIALEPQAKNISLDFHAADITDVLKALSVQSGTNIVTGTDVKGQVTVSLNRVSLRDALDMITKLSGYGYMAASEGTYLVGTSEALNSAMGVVAMPAQTIFETVPICYANAEQLAKSLPDMVPGLKVAVQENKRQDASSGAPSTDQNGTMTGSTITGQKEVRTLLISGSMDQVTTAKDIIAKVEDSMRMGYGGVEVITKTYRIRYSDALELGKLINSVVPAVSVAYGPTTNFQLTEPEKLKGGYGGDSGKYEFKVQPEMLIFTGSEDDVARVFDLLEEVDIKPVQILIEAKILDINNDAAKDIGIDWSWSTFSSTGQTNINNTNEESLDSELLDQTGAAAVTGLRYGDGGTIVEALDTTLQELSIGRTVTRTLQLGPTQLLAKLNLMVTSGTARLLANPKVAAIVGKPANIFIGDEVKYVISIQNTTTGQNIQTETAQVGIQLRTIGTVGPDNSITLNLHPEVSVISKYLNLGNGIALPQIARRFTDSTIRIKSGQTIAIGGLIKESEILSMSKIPFLGDLPFLGQLFQHKNKSKEHSEIAILITATILDDDEPYNP